MTVEKELDAAIQKIMSSESRRKLIVAGPGTGKTTLFRKLLELGSGDQGTSRRHRDGGGINSPPSLDPEAA